MTKIVQVQQRRICWPRPDATCLAGGCIHCNSGPWKNVGEIATYARGAGVLPHRGRGEEDAMQAFRYGRDNGWPNIDQRTVPKRVSTGA